MRRFLLPAAIALALLMTALWLRERGRRRLIDASAETEPAGEAPALGARPTRRPPALDENALLRARVAQLTEEIEKVKAAQSKEETEKKRDCLTSVTPECPFLDQSADELKEMARCGIVHLDLPNLDQAPDPSETLTAEQQQIETARVAVNKRVRAQLEALYKEADFDRPVPKTIRDLSRALEEEVRLRDRSDVDRQIARERAGLATPPPPEQQSLAQRYWHLQADVGDWYEEALAKHLGAARAHALRVEGNGWPYRAIHSGSCEDAGAR